MKIREARVAELSEIAAFFDQDVDYRVAVFENYIPDCPGWCGDVYAVIGGYAEACCFLIRNEHGKLEALRSEIAAELVP